MGTTHTITPVSSVASWLLVAIVFFLPWQTRWIAISGTLNGGGWEYGTVSLYALDILIIFFVLFAGVHRFVERKETSFSSRQLMAVFLLAVAFFSMAFAENQLNALFWCLKLAEGIALFILVPSLPVRWNWVGGAFVTSALIQSTLAITQFFAQKVSGSKWFGMSEQFPEIPGVQVVGTATERILRAYGSLPHPNMVAGLLVVTIIITLLIYTHHTPTATRVPYGVSLAIMSAALWTTFSRQAWISLAFVLVALITHTFITRQRFPKPLAVGTLFILIPLVTFSLIMPGLIAARIGNTTSNEHRSISERQEYAQQSAEILRTEWVTGVGIGNYTAYTHQRDNANGIEKRSSAYQPVHNIYLLIFTELGIFGLLAFLAFLFTMARGLGRSNHWTIGLSLATVALLIIGLFDHYLWTLHFGIILFWLVLGLLERSRIE